MKKWVLQLDELLRGEKTSPRSLNDSRISINIFGVSIIVCLLAVSYGLCMGSFAMARGLEAGTSDAFQQGLMQTLASMAKMPILFLCTLCITFPSLYVFSALSGSQMKVGEVFKLLIAALAINLAVLASLGPIVAFFSVSTPSYHFVLLLNVFCCAAAGMMGLAFLLQTLYRMTAPKSKEAVIVPTSDLDIESPVGEPMQISEPGPLMRTPDHVLGRHVRKIFLIWVIVFGLVGAQMSWVLRPFVGSPDKEFAWLRPRDSNVFQAILNALQGLFG